jgi:aspartyl-tRNA(Asn)/glutamyl-tRNA(Gln) amidotransferase subunit A
VNELADWSVEQTARAIAAREISAREVVAASLERADEWQPSCNAFVATFRDASLAAADAADARVRRGGMLPALLGVPLAHKDLFFRTGRVSGCGSHTRRPPEHTTSTLLSRLDDAGAIEIGALHMCEYALGPTGHNAWLGDCRNPWQLDHVPGGSSSGSGAAVAARIVAASLGTDTGGSIRLPASLCGVIGLKPTFGLLSRHGMLPLATSLDTPGICARSCGDLALLMTQLVGRDPGDETTARAPAVDFAPGDASPVSKPLSGIRIGTPHALTEVDVATDVCHALTAALGDLASFGAGIVEVTVPSLQRLAELSRLLVYAEATTVHLSGLQAHPREYSDQVRIRAATGLAIPASAYQQTLAERAGHLRSFVSAVFAACDVLYLPTLPIAGPTLLETDIGGAGPMWEKIAAMVPCTAPFNYLGLPALSMPCGFTDNGVPTGFQLVGRPYADAFLLRMASAYEPISEPLRRRPVRPG